MSLNKFFSFSAIFMLFFATCFASHPNQDAQPSLVKKYISQDNVFFHNGNLLIAEGQNLLYVKTLHQDSEGVYYYHAWLYGYCPNGHPYTADGGCLGYNCPYN